MTAYTDRMLVCVECADEFVWLAGEQQYFALHDFQQPRRCRPCRQARRAQRESEQAEVQGERWPRR